MKRESIVKVLLLVIVFYIVFYRLFIMTNLKDYSQFINAAFLVVLSSISILLLGYRKDKLSELKKNILYSTLIAILIFAFLMFVGGIKLGFGHNIFSLEFSKILGNITAPIVIIIFEELFRYVIVSANKDKKWIIILLPILLSLFEVIISINNFYCSNFGEVFYLVFRDITPIIVKNVVMTYLVYYSGYKVTIIYRLITEIYIFILPIIPNLGEYIDTIIKVVLPLCILIYSYGIIDSYYNGVQHSFVKDSFRITDIPIYGCVILLICLISGYFPHTLVGIGSNSMRPHFSKGSAVLIEKTDEEDLKVGDIIGYYHNKRLIIHRVNSIETKKGTKIYHTKGDANNSVDPIDIKYKDIKGKVVFSVPYVAYPTVWLSEIMNK